MKNKNNLFGIIVVTLAIGLFLGKRWALYNRTKTERLKGAIVSDSIEPQPSLGPNMNAVATSSEQSKVSSDEAQKKAEALNPANIDLAEYYKKQTGEKVAQVFKRSGLVVKLPDNMTFDAIEVGIPQSVAAYGKSQDQAEGLTYIAAKKMPSVEEVSGFLKNSSDEIPNLSNKTVQWDDSVESFTLNKESGIKEGFLWRGKDASGQYFAAVVLTRQDGQGSYMFIKDGPASSMVDNEGYYEQFKESVKALPLSE